MPIFTANEPLHLAVELRDKRRVTELLEAGMAVDTRTREKVTPLMVAAKRGFDEIVELLIRNGAELDAKDMAVREEDSRRTALMDAAQSGHASTCRLLLEAGADPNSTSQWGNTALNYACNWNSLPVVQVLLQHGGNPNGSDKCGDLTPLSIAAGRDNVKIIHALLDAGADPNTPRDKSPLVWAGKVESIRALLQYGADVNLRDSDGRSAIYHAIPAGKLEVIQCLIEAGADVNLASAHNETPLMQMKLSPRLDVTKLLVQSGANVNYLVDEKTSILDHVRHGYHDYIPTEARERAEIVKYLCASGAKTAGELEGSA